MPSSSTARAVAREQTLSTRRRHHAAVQEPDRLAQTHRASSPEPERARGRRRAIPSPAGHRSAKPVRARPQPSRPRHYLQACLSLAVHDALTSDTPQGARSRRLPARGDDRRPEGDAPAARAARRGLRGHGRLDGDQRRGGSQPRQARPARAEVDRARGGRRGAAPGEPIATPTPSPTCAAPEPPQPVAEAPRSGSSCSRLPAEPRQPAAKTRRRGQTSWRPSRARLSGLSSPKDRGCLSIGLGAGAAAVLVMVIVLIVWWRRGRSAARPPPRPKAARRPPQPANRNLTQAILAPVDGGEARRRRPLRALQKERPPAGHRKRTSSRSGRARPTRSGYPTPARGLASGGTATGPETRATSLPGSRSPPRCSS